MPAAQEHWHHSAVLMEVLKIASLVSFGDDDLKRVSSLVPPDYRGSGMLNLLDGLYRAVKLADGLCFYEPLPELRKYASECWIARRAGEHDPLPPRLIAERLGYERPSRLDQERPSGRVDKFGDAYIWYRNPNGAKAVGPNYRRPVGRPRKGSPVPCPVPVTATIPKRLAKIPSPKSLTRREFAALFVALYPPPDGITVHINSLAESRRINGRAIHISDSADLLFTDFTVCHGKPLWRIRIAARNGRGRATNTERHAVIFRLSKTGVAINPTETRFTRRTSQWMPMPELALVDANPYVGIFLKSLSLQSLPASL